MNKKWRKKWQNMTKKVTKYDKNLQKSVTFLQKVGPFLSTFVTVLKKVVQKCEHF